LIVGKRFIAACHDAVSLQHAQHIGCDAVFLSPVKRLKHIQMQKYWVGMILLH
jgi:hypothetical protein